MKESLVLALQNAKNWLESMEPQQFIKEFEALSGEDHGVLASEFVEQLQAAMQVGFEVVFLDDVVEPLYFNLREFWEFSEQRAHALSSYACNDDNYAMAA